MYKDTFREVLKSESMKFTVKEIEEIMDEELNKSPEEMDTELIDLCTEVLEKAYLNINDSDLKSEKTEKNKVIKIRKVILVAAIVAVFLCATMPVIGAKFSHFEISKNIVTFYDDYIDLDLKKGKTDAKNHSDGSIAIVKELKKQLETDEIILPSLILSAEYEKEITHCQENVDTVSVAINISSKISKTSGYISIDKYTSNDYNYAMGTGQLTKEFDCVQQLTINGMDVMILGNDSVSFITYLDKNVEYTIYLENCNFEKGVQIAGSIVQ